MSAIEIERRFVAWCEEKGLPFGAGVVVAVSGGGDSCALLALLCETDVVSRERVVGAYFDHRLRGEDASREERDVVTALCARYGIQLDAGAWGAPVASEAAAREARYAFLAEVARTHGAPAVVTGHTSDDQVETVLMHAIRGAGLYGLAGMDGVSPWPFVSHNGLALVRPLLGLSREDTHAYCSARRITYIDDTTNADARFLRNRVRRDLLPSLDATAPLGRAAILRLAEEARAGIDAIMQVVAPLVIDRGDGCMRVSRAALRALPRELASHAYRAALVRLLGDARDFERRHYAILVRAHDARTGSTFALPRDVVVTVDPDVVLLSSGAPLAATIDDTFARAVPFAGVVGAWRIEVAASLEAVALPLPAGSVVRGRRPGDRIRPRGMRGHKSLQDYYVDRKVPRRARDAAPVIARDSEVLWTPFGGAAEPSGAGHRYRVFAAREGEVLVGRPERQV
jgi:tRNA(Ile)-lysidine synthase